MNNKIKKNIKLTEEKMIKLFAKKIVDKHMSVPSILFLDIAKPLSFIGSQFLNFYGPFIEPFFSKGNFYQFTTMLEKRENIEKILLEIEKLEDERKNSLPQKKTHNTKKVEK